MNVLYVEDEPFLGKIVKESLESRGFTVNMVDDGNGVLAAFERFEPEICILDVMLPNKDGYTLGKEIRQLYPNLPILFLTAKTQTDDVLKGFQSGGNDYIRKPFSMEELIVRIQNLVQLTQGKAISPSNGVVNLGRYEFLPQKYELRFGEQVRKLSYREVELLKILNDHRNQTASRRDMLLKVWGDDSFFNSRNLDVYITKLRDYLKEDSAIQIVTIKGVGYHFTV
ncbi:MAG: response regulator transcription factor [Spirosomataceae bacterium]